MCFVLFCNATMLSCMLNCSKTRMIHEQPDASDREPVSLPPGLPPPPPTTTRSFATFHSSLLGQHTFFTVSLDCDRFRRHGKATHWCESHDSASTEQDGVTQERRVQLIRFRLWMLTEPWLEFVLCCLLLPRWRARRLS